MILTDVLHVLISWAGLGQGQGHAYWDLLSACLHHTSDCCYNGANTVTTGIKMIKYHAALSCQQLSDNKTYFKWIILLVTVECGDYRTVVSRSGYNNIQYLVWKFIHTDTYFTAAALIIRDRNLVLCIIFIALLQQLQHNSTCIVNSPQRQLNVSFHLRMPRPFK